MKPSKPTTKPYTRRSESYKAEVLKLADRIGYTEAARQLGLHESQLYGWRAKQSHQQTVSSRELGCNFMYTLLHNHGWIIISQGYVVL